MPLKWPVSATADIASTNEFIVETIAVRLNKPRVDFALYHFETDQWVAVVELDGRSHDTTGQKAEDARPDRILTAAA